MTTIERIENESENAAIESDYSNLTVKQIIKREKTYERNKAIQEAIDYYKSSTGKMVDRRSLIAALETFKIKDVTP